MKLVLASQGFCNDEISNKVSELVGKPLENINIAIINEAYTALPGEMSKRWLINELSRIIKYIGGNIDFVNLRAYTKNEVKQRCLASDLIYIVGGKQFILPQLFKETGFDETLRELVTKRVIMGTSAGSMVLGRQIESDKYWITRYNKKASEIEDRNMGLIDTNIIPHYLRKDRSKWDKAFYDDVLKDNPFPVYAINDSQALIYDNGEIYFVGGKPEIFGKRIKKYYENFVF